MKTFASIESSFIQGLQLKIGDLKAKDRTVIKSDTIRMRFLALNGYVDRLLKELQVS